MLLAMGGSGARADTTVALVVGNSAYQSAPALTNPLNDARDMSAALKAAGFTVYREIISGMKAPSSTIMVGGDRGNMEDGALISRRCDPVFE